MYRCKEASLKNKTTYYPLDLTNNHKFKRLLVHATIDFIVSRFGYIRGEKWEKKWNEKGDTTSSSSHPEK